MITSLDSTPEARCVRYVRELRLPATLDPGSRHILLRIGIDYGAISMPTELGEQVLRRLTHEGIAGPVIDHPRARRWTFLTGPARPGPLSTSVSAELFRLYVTVAGAGCQVVLPSPDDERTGYRIWIRSPESIARRPSLDTVIAAMRTVTACEIRGE
ncbi:hypothetical protein ACL02S_03965 [Nocardia sp. 004]|uniref:hypothetical protein n=1 Tax=Nocardia sp. 004 TaxID=3385978 RepID=UPI0039A1BE46